MKIREVFDGMAKSAECHVYSDYGYLPLCLFLTINAPFMQMWKDGQITSYYGIEGVVIGFLLELATFMLISMNVHYWFRKWGMMP